MHEDFIRLAYNFRNKRLLQAEALFVLHKNTWLAAFADHFKTACAKIVELQKESSLPAISHLEYTMLYTNFINRRYVSEAWVYGDKRYLDKNQRMVGEYDISFLFAEFDALWNELLTARKKYAGKVSSREITAFMLEALPDFYSYLINIARFAITEIVEQKPFIDIIKNDVFRVNVGDYMAKTEPVLTQSKSKDANALAGWFSEQLENEYSFEDYSHLDFSGGSFPGTDFRYADFRGAVLDNVSFDSSQLIGANFSKARMDNCRLDNCSIQEADFSYAIMKHTSFIGTRAGAGLTNETEWKFVGFLPVSFRHTDLTDADFKWANLKGADFSGAVLTGVDFTGAIVDGAIFSDTNPPLTDTQKSKIIIKG